MFFFGFLWISSTIYLYGKEKSVKMNSSASMNLLYYGTLYSVHFCYKMYTMIKLNALNQLNSIHRNLSFNSTEAKNNQINYLDLTIKRDNKEKTMDIYRKTTTSDITIHFTSNNLMEYKLAAYRYMLHRMCTLPITKQARTQELDTILEIAYNNGFPVSIIQELCDRIKQKFTSNN
jgi:hypothetical protein